MKISSVGTLAAFLAIGKASASWLTEDCFPKPSSCDNKCTDEQRGGWHWSGLSAGLPFSSFDGYDFSGFTCSDKGGLGKRSSDKCISGSISKSGQGSSPRISCGEDKDAFSITSFSVYTEEETDVVFSYGMPDGSQCQHTSTCGPEGTDVSNDQCGGATSVSWTIPDHSGVESCGFGIYSIGFDCTPGEGNHGHTSIPGNSFTIPPASVTVPAVSVPSVSVPSVSIPDVSVTIPSVSIPDTSVTLPAISIPDISVTVPAVSVPTNTPSVPSFSVSVPSGSFSVSIPAGTGPTGPAPAVSSTAVVPPSPSVTPQSWTTSTVWTTTLVTVTSCAPTVTNCPANSQSVITKTIALSTTICPVTATETGIAVPTGGSSPSETSVSPVQTSTPGGSTTPGSTPGSTPGGESCPSVVPKCINTWMPDTCSDNTDVSCYCPSSNVTSNIISCIQSWGSDASEISSALSYFTGICSGYIPGNPGIITAVPTTIPLTPPAATATGTQVAPAGGSVPCTTITYASTTYTVPQIAFTTTTGTEVGGATTAVVGLIPVTTAPAVVAPTTGVVPAPAGGVSTLATTVVGGAGPTGVLPTSKTSGSSTLAPFTGAAVPGATVSKQGIVLGGVMGLLAMLI